MSIGALHHYNTFKPHLAIKHKLVYPLKKRKYIFQNKMYICFYYVYYHWVYTIYSVIFFTLIFINHNMWLPIRSYLYNINYYNRYTYTIYFYPTLSVQLRLTCRVSSHPRISYISNSTYMEIFNSCSIVRIFRLFKRGFLIITIILYTVYCVRRFVKIIIITSLIYNRAINQRYYYAQYRVI